MRMWTIYSSSATSVSRCGIFLEDLWGTLFYNSGKDLGFLQEPCAWKSHFTCIIGVGICTCFKLSIQTWRRVINSININPLDSFVTFFFSIFCSSGGTSLPHPWLCYLLRNLCNPQCFSWKRNLVWYSWYAHLEPRKKIPLNSVQFLFHLYRVIWRKLSN